MIFGIGTDVFEVDRMKAMIEKDEGFTASIFTSSEISYCEKMSYPEQHFAARFSAKEAFMKALGTGWRYGITFCDINIINDELGKPIIMLGGKAKELADQSGIKNIHVTMSHVKEYVSVFVILEK